MSKESWCVCGEEAVFGGLCATCPKPTIGYCQRCGVEVVDATPGAPGALFCQGCVTMVEAGCRRCGRAYMPVTITAPQVGAVAARLCAPCLNSIMLRLPYRCANAPPCAEGYPGTRAYHLREAGFR